ncbi:MAG: GyrI-like domain-containing protein [Anaerolineales bacterium]|nr:GyrI-like domain-containing protein [Anaerolineales bacterium]MBX3037570.1 GyrI-like domain-containing protein [Anaerolineales bacterium]
MKILDLKKQFKHLYQPSAKKVEAVQVPNLQFAMIDGQIEKGSEPGKSPRFAEATGTLYSLCYTLKFTFKKRDKNAIDYPVMPLEGLWGVTDEKFDITIKDNWTYTLMIMQPEVVTKEIFEEAKENVRKKKGDSELLSQVKLEYFEEGLCVQTMHIGPYATEMVTLERMREFMQENGLFDNVGPNGLHHEIYISDPRKAKPEKMKTVLRHPVGKLKK